MQRYPAKRPPHIIIVSGESFSIAHLALYFAVDDFRKISGTVSLHINKVSVVASIR